MAQTTEQKLDRLVSRMESELEGDNYHSQICVVDRVRRALLKHVDAETALKILRSIGSFMP